MTISERISMMAPTIFSLTPLLWIVLAIIVMLFWRSVQMDNMKARQNREREIQLLLSNQRAIESRLQSCGEANQAIQEVRRLLVMEFAEDYH